MNKYVTKTKKVKSGRIISFLLAVCLLITSIQFVPLKSLAKENVNANAGQAISEDSLEVEQSAESEAVTLSAEEITTLRAEMKAELATSKIFDYVDESQFVAANHVSRLYNEEELNTYVFLNEDGSHTMYLLDENVKYVAEDGSIKEKDVTLVQKGNTSSGDVSVMSAGLFGGNAGAISGDYTVKSNNIGLTLPNDISKGIELTHGTKKVTLTPLGISNFSANLKATANASLNTVSYNSAYGSGVSLKYTPTLSGIKEDIVLTSYTGTNSFSFTLATNGMYVYNDVNGDHYIAETEESVQRFSLGRIVVYDANKRQSLGSMTVETVKEGQLYLLTVSADETFLLDSKTVYPVTIDPSITVSSSTDSANIVDVTVYDNAPVNEFGTEMVNYVGYRGGDYGNAMTFMKLAGLANNSVYKTLNATEITNVDVTVSGLNSGMIAVGLHRVTSVINDAESAINWTTVNGKYSATVSSSHNIGANATTNIDITSFVKGWKNGNYVNTMSFVLAPHESTSSRCAQFVSSEATNVTMRPYVKLDYTFKNLINNGTYYIENKQLGTYMQPKNGATASGTAMELWSFSGTEKQQWTLTSLGNGYYKIISTLSGLALSVASSDVSKENGAVVQEAYTGATRQQWRIYRTIYGGMAIKPCSAGTGVNVLSVSDGNNGNGAVVSQRGYAYNASYKDEWYLSPVIISGEKYLVKNKQLNDKYLSSKNNFMYSYGEIQVLDYSNALHQRWVFVSVGQGFFKIVNEENGLVLSIRESDITSTSGKVIQQEYVGGENQQWKIYLSISNGLYIKPRSASSYNLVLSITDNTADASQRPEVFNTSYKEEWLLEDCVPFKDGVYYIRNRQLRSYIQVSGYYGASTVASTLDTILHSFSLQNSQCWQLTHIEDGYYKITSVLTGYALSLAANDTSLENGAIIQTTYTGLYRQQWKIYLSGYGGYIIKPRTAENTNFVLSVSEGNLGNGAVVSQRAYVANDSYKDEWFLLGKASKPTHEIQATNVWCWVAAAKIAASKYLSDIPISQESAAVYVNTDGSVDSENPTQAQINAATTTGDRKDTQMAMEYFLGADEGFCYSKNNHIYSLETLRKILAEGNVVVASRHCYTFEDSNWIKQDAGHSIVIYEYGGTITDINGGVHDAFWVYDSNNRNWPRQLFVTYEWLCNTGSSVRNIGVENSRVVARDLSGNYLSGNDYGTAEANFVDPINGIYENNRFEWYSICVVKMGSYSETISK